nr:MAG TPA: hypothetical protein [Caudoviricetes sp.]
MKNIKKIKKLIIRIKINVANINISRYSLIKINN